MRTVFLPCAAAALFLLGCATASGDAGQEPVLQVRIINFNFETVRVTWSPRRYSGTNLTFVYKLSSDEASRPCCSYIVHEGHTAGCLLEARKDEILCFSLGNGTDVLFRKCEWISAYLKPSSPEDLSFRWHEDAVTVTCSDLPYKRLLYEIQYKSIFDTEWQSKEGETCNVTMQGLDSEKCYFFRARVKTLESSYGSDTYPSDWSKVTHQQRGELRDSCQDKKLFPKFILICGMVALLTVSLLLLSLWKVRRLHKCLMPSVPDPKLTFPGLFELHRGNFQEWIKDTQNVSHVAKTEATEQECVPEETLVVQLQKAEAEMPIVTTGPLCPPMEGEEASGDASLVACQPPQGGEVVSLGGFTFVMTDNSYMLL
ncbi:cytokine receptor-like factor 2 [Herpailurus yagouaroundi]|uniref:cytokine receptor-like factor 2 n=1 Tax=Herpailurus yagouaroundi TaxID=1608482 RepID=UPI001AD66677|nr:cytokine receptor-like factor 2 [Puma yagouaroundi]